MDTFYITTPIYYVNDVPHIGHSYTTIIGDAISRFKKVMGYDVFYLTGTDEHGQKIEKSAKKKGITPIELADKVVERFKTLWKELNIEYDFFIRTTMDFHEKGVQNIFEKLLKKGDIYKGVYTGWYCVSCENYISDDEKEDSEGRKICPDCGRPTEKVSEDVYFFRLSAYQEKLLDFYEKNPDFVIPEGRMNEVVSFVKGGLKDLSITRSTVKWGIKVPSDNSQTIYVWFDALHNYITGIGYGTNDEKFKKWWPADVHLIGKDILRFHAVFWPAFLMAAGLELPKKIIAHGWWLKDKKKMSKSIGNVLDPYLLINNFGADSLRYFVLREIPIGIDGNFSHEGFIHRVNSDLANDLGNLVNRVWGMAKKYFSSNIPVYNGKLYLEEEYESLRKDYIEFFNKYHINRALERVWAFVGDLNRFIVEKEPWKLHKEGKKDEVSKILLSLAQAIRGVFYLIYPVMPVTSVKVLKAMGLKELPEKEFKFNFNEIFSDIKLKEIPQLFPRVDKDEFFKENKEEKKMEEKKEIEEKKYIKFEEFKKVEMVVAKILEVMEIEGADKLYRLRIDIGEEKREILAGIKQYYKPEELLNKKIIVVKNLEPKKLRGFLSNGMLLAANIDGKPVIPFLPDDVPCGSPMT